MIRALISLCILSVCCTGCTAMRYQHHTEIDYIPPDVAQIQRSKTYVVDYEKAWKTAVAVFALNNFQIKTMDKDSGIIAAEAFYNPADMLEMVTTGQTVIIEYETEEKMVPNGFVGSGNPNYVRQYGNVKESKTYETSRLEAKSEYSVTAFLNLFLQSNEPNSVIFNVNVKFQTQERIGEKVPQPTSNGTLEKQIFGFLDEKLQQLNNIYEDKVDN